MKKFFNRKLLTVLVLLIAVVPLAVVLSGCATNVRSRDIQGYSWDLVRFESRAGGITSSINPGESGWFDSVMILHADGTFDESWGSFDTTGTWNVRDGRLNMFGGAAGPVHTSWNLRLRENGTRLYKSGQDAFGVTLTYIYQRLSPESN